MNMSGIRYIFFFSISLSSCVSQNPQVSPACDHAENCVSANLDVNRRFGLPDINELLNTPIDCELVDSTSVTSEENTGFSTPDIALENWGDAELPSGQIALTLITRDRAVWLYQVDEINMGMVVAIKQPADLWVVSHIERCLEE